MLYRGKERFEVSLRWGRIDRISSKGAKSFMARSETKRLKLVYIAVERIAIVSAEKFVICFVTVTPLGLKRLIISVRSFG
jgi:hypothetical protein